MSSSYTGLTTAEVQKRRQQVGPNELVAQKKRTVFHIFGEQFQNILIILLLIAAVVAFSLGEQLDALLIGTIVLLNAFFGLYQEKKAEDAIDALKEMTKTKVRVIRDGVEVEVDSRELVPGDIIFIEEGVKIPVDGVILEETNLQVNEAGLTGESLPISKLEQQEVYAGTIVTRGRAMVETTATGMKTKFGEIAARLSQIDKSKTLLEKKLESFTQLIGILGIICSVLVIVLMLLQGSSLLTSVLLGVSLAVAVVPEGLPAVMTITLALGVKEMAKRKAILRKLSAIEALGSITVIATDKTGTLTSNSMEVKEIWQNGALFRPEKLPVQDPAFVRLVENGLLCSTASLAKMGGKKSLWQILGDPTEGALLILGKDVDMHYEDVRAKWINIFEQPFNSVDKRMSVTVKHKDIVTYTKGAVESVLAISSHIEIQGKKLPLTDLRKAEIKSVMEHWANQGLRVLAFSYKQHQPGFEEKITSLKKLADDEKYTSAVAEMFEGQTISGLVAMYDPPRKEVRQALLKAQEAGISVVMVTGDNPRTAQAIATAIGLWKAGDKMLTGDQVEKLSDSELRAMLPNVRIFARVSPFHKSRIVELYQKQGEIVAVTGDGVNDSIALKQADIGVAMGLIGTDVARETADMIITDDNFATIINAVEEGRNIIKNMRNAIKYLLSTNVVEAIVIIVGIFLGFPHMFTAIQLLYINLLSDGIPSLILSFSPREEMVMKRKPVRKVELVNRFDLHYVIWLGAAAAVIVLASFFYFRTVPGVDQRAVVFVVLALIQPFFLIDLWITHQPYIKHIREFTQPIFIAAFMYPFVILFVMITNSQLAPIFKVEAITPQVFALCVAISSTILIPIMLFNRLMRTHLNE
jgi:Ca2+-transporting ATPase